MINLHSDEEMTPVFLIGLDLKDGRNFEKSLNEMHELAEACDMKVISTFTQYLPKVNTGYYIGSGKIEEIKAAIEMMNPELILCDNQLSPMQLKNLTDEFGVQVLDRTALILRIFSERARTREAILQVEYARYQYLLPRLRGLHTDLGRQGGASGAMSNKGSGEKKIELDKRKIESKMAEVRRELEVVERERTTQRNARMRSGLPRVSLVGYTNAGKSTIMNGMLSRFGSDDEKKVFEKDMLFATLDTTVRRIEPGKDRKPFLLSDTVGFIDNLPTTLVKAFRSTLEETKYADLLCIVSDLSDPEFRENLAVTVRTLVEIGAGDIPRLYVFNKADLAGTDPLTVISSELIIAEDERITISAKKPEDIERLAEALGRSVNRGRTECTLLIPYTKGAALSALKESSDMTILDYQADGTLVKAMLEASDVKRYQEFIQK